MTSRTRHLVGNLEAAPLENGELQARTAFSGVPLAPGDRIINSSPVIARTYCVQ